MNLNAKPVGNRCFRDYKKEQKENLEFKRNSHREKVCAWRCSVKAYRLTKLSFVTN